MKIKNLLITSILLFTLMLFMGCVSTGGTSSVANVPDPTNGEPQWWLNMKGPAYQVLVYSFFDSNNDGYGDLKGVEQKLDYIKDLGSDVIWLSPIMPSESYHAYDVVSFYDIDERLGTVEDFLSLVNEAHKKDIKILL